MAQSSSRVRAYILDVEAFTLGFELAAVFLAGIGLALLPTRGMLRLVGVAALVIAAIVFLSGLIGTASISSGINQVGFLLFILWTLIAGVYLLIRPPRLASRAGELL